MRKVQKQKKKWPTSQDLKLDFPIQVSIEIARICLGGGKSWKNKKSTQNSMQRTQKKRVSTHFLCAGSILSVQKRKSSSQMLHLVVGFSMFFRWACRTSRRLGGNSLYSIHRLEDYWLRFVHGSNHLVISILWHSGFAGAPSWENLTTRIIYLYMTYLLGNHRESI